MTTIFTIRPQPGCRATVAAGHDAGLAIIPAPLFAVRPLDWAPPPPDGVDALLLGSANAMRHGGTGLAQFTGKPVYAVGAATAEAAQIAGFSVARTGSGGLQTLLDDWDGGPIRLLRLAGADHVPLYAPPDLSITTRIVYESAGLPLPDDLAERLRQGDAVVLLHSAAAARHFRAECERLGIVRGAIVLAVIGERIAAAAGQGWAAIHCASSPDDTALLALAHELCQ